MHGSLSNATFNPDSKDAGGKLLMGAVAISVAHAGDNNVITNVHPQDVITDVATAAISTEAGGGRSEDDAPADAEVAGHVCLPNGAVS